MMQRSRPEPPFAAYEPHIISVSPFDEDHFALQRIVRDRDCPGPVCRLSAVRDLPSARKALDRAIYPVVVCERSLPFGSWKELLDHVQTFTWPPPLIVTSLHADEYLWAEALNLGAYDVLAKPFDSKETARVMRLACLRSRPDRMRGRSSAT